MLYKYSYIVIIAKKGIHVVRLKSIILCKVFHYWKAKAPPEDNGQLSSAAMATGAKFI